MRRMLVLSIALGVVAPAARADEVELNGGTRVTGDILVSDDAGVRLLLASNEEILLAKADVKRVVISEGAPGGDSFTRGEKSGDHPGLQTGVVHYRKAGAPRVDLVGAVHAADLAYFHEVQALLDREEVVLYEMIKKQGQDPGARADDAAREQSPVSKFQVALGRALDRDLLWRGPYAGPREAPARAGLRAGRRALVDRLGRRRAEGDRPSGEGRRTGTHPLPPVIGRVRLRVMRPAVVLLVAAIALVSCRAGRREGLGPTGVPLGTVRAPESATGPASAPPAAPIPPSPAGTAWKAEYYKISDG